MQRDLVERRAWISRQDFLDGVALGQTMPGQWFIRHRDNRQIQAFVKGAAAAAAGAIAGAVVVLSRQTIHDWVGVAIAITALGLLLRWKVKEPILVGLAAAAGLLLHW
jgi:chromate transporter